MNSAGNFSCQSFRLSRTGICFTISFSFNKVIYLDQITTQKSNLKCTLNLNALAWLLNRSSSRGVGKVHQKTIKNG